MFLFIKKNNETIPPPLSCPCILNSFVGCYTIVLMMVWLGIKFLSHTFFFPPSGKESMFSCFLFIACIPFILFYLISQRILQGSIILQFISWLVIMAQFYLAVPLPYTDSYFFFLIQEHFFEACLWIFLLSIISVAIFEGPTFNSLACLP